jgi:DNA polymerase-3 subunit gamma/tau
VFENILYQPVIEQLKADAGSGFLAPALLFSGPPYGGKGAAALELARVLSCEGTETGKWNCPCPSCRRHRNLISPDLIILGKKGFFQEISACSAALVRHTKGANNSGEQERILLPVRMLFIRSIRKLLARFNPVLWEDDSKFGKISPQLNALEEDLEELEGLFKAGTVELEKPCASIMKRAAKLESEGLGELIPIAQIRRASWWSRLAPLGKHKCIIIENAGHMQEGAKNALLKILEEPPPRLTLVLTSPYPMSLLPTMLSRLRDYRFVTRDPGAEQEVISRIFRGPENYTGGLESYLGSFLPFKAGNLYALGAYLASSVAAEAVRELRSRMREIPPILLDQGKFFTGIAEGEGMGRPAVNYKTLLAKILTDTDNFEIPGLFSQFFRELGSLISRWLRSGRGSPEKALWAARWRKEINRSLVEADSFNIAVPTVLERFLETLKTGMIA